MAEKGSNKKKKQYFSYMQHLQPLSMKEKEELKMRIYVAIRQFTTLNRS